MFVESVDEDGELLASNTSSSSRGFESSSSEIRNSRSSSSFFYNSSSSVFYFSSSSRFSSSSSRLDYLSEDKQMELTLTYYRQLKSYEGTSTTTDGDPIIYFKVIAIDSYDDTLATVKTSKIFNSKSDKTNLSVWSGDSSVYVDVPRNTYAISVCPIVYDYDPFSDDNVSSGYCYIRWRVGQLNLKEKVYQEDEESSFYELEWNWNLY